MPQCRALRRAAKYSAEAIDVLRKVYLDENQPVAARIAAASIVLDRAMGKPPQAITLEESAPAHEMLEGDYTEAELVALEEQAKQLAAKNEAGAHRSNCLKTGRTVPNAVKNGSKRRDPFAPPTALPFGVWK